MMQVILTIVITIAAMAALYFLMRARAQRLSLKLKEIEDKLNSQKPQVTVIAEQESNEGSGKKREEREEREKEPDLDSIPPFLPDEDTGEVFVSKEIREDYFLHPERRQKIQLSMVMDVLKILGTQPEIRDNDEIRVRYQGETFVIICGGSMIRIWDPAWESVNINSTELNIVRTILNIVNFDSSFAGLLSRPDKDGNMVISSKMDAVFVPDLPNLDEYMRKLLSYSFQYKDNFRTVYQDLRHRDTHDIENMLVSPGAITNVPAN